MIGLLITIFMIAVIPMIWSYFLWGAYLRFAPRGMSEEYEDRDFNFIILVCVVWPAGLIFLTMFVIADIYDAIEPVRNFVKRMFNSLTIIPRRFFMFMVKGGK